MNLQKANDQLNALRPFQYCYVHTESEGKTTAVGSYVVNDKEGSVIFARRVDMLTRQIIETEHFLGDEYGDIKKALEAHYNLDFIFKDCVILAFELIRDADDYPSDSFGYHEKYGCQVFYSDVDYLRVDGDEIATHYPTIEI